MEKNYIITVVSYLHNSKIPWFFKSSQRTKFNERRKIKSNELIQARHTFITCSSTSGAGEIGNKNEVREGHAI